MDGWEGGVIIKGRGVSYAGASQLKLIFQHTITISDPESSSNQPI